MVVGKEAEDVWRSKRSSPNLKNLVYCVCGVPVLIKITVFFGPEQADHFLFQTLVPLQQLLAPIALGSSRHLDKKSMEESVTASLTNVTSP